MVLIFLVIEKSQQIFPLLEKESRNHDMFNSIFLGLLDSRVKVRYQLFSEEVVATSSKPFSGGWLSSLSLSLPAQLTSTFAASFRWEKPPWPPPLLPPISKTSIDSIFVKIPTNWLLVYTKQKTTYLSLAWFIVQVWVTSAAWFSVGVQTASPDFSAIITAIKTVGTISSKSRNLSSM